MASEPNKVEERRQAQAAPSQAAADDLPKPNIENTDTKLESPTKQERILSQSGTINELMQRITAFKNKYDFSDSYIKR